MGDWGEVGLAERELDFNGRPNLRPLGEKQPKDLKIVLDSIVKRN